MITGGPCAGKSECLEKLREHFSLLGYEVRIINEVAKELMSGGKTPETYGRDNYQTFQLKTQLEREETVYNLLKESQCEKGLIICDRGAMDGLAYMDKQSFISAAKSIGKNLIELRDGYDAVFFLESAANSDGDVYTTANNPVRTEDKETARQIDRLTLNAWVGTPHLRFIGVKDTFDEKVNCLIKSIESFLGEPKPLEIENKYLIAKPDEDTLLKMPDCAVVEITQTYFNSKNERFRLRARGTDGNYIYFRTEKKQITPLIREEIEERLTKEQYDSLMSDTSYNKKTLLKKRYCLMENGTYCEIDVYPFFKDFATLEIEKDYEEQEVAVPKSIPILKDVTDDKSFRNSNLAAKYGF